MVLTPEALAERDPHTLGPIDERELQTQTYTQRRRVVLTPFPGDSPSGSEIKNVTKNTMCVRNSRAT